MNIYSEKMELEAIKSNKNYKLLKSDKNDYFLFRNKQNENVNESIDDIFWTEYSSNVFYEEETYESIRFKEGVNFNLINDLFELVCREEWTLWFAISEIEKIIRLTFDKKFRLEIIRGTFGELKMIIDRKLKPMPQENAIYDLYDDLNDYEIKTYSKIEKKVYIKFQQLNNNPEAIFLFLELIETGTGESVIDLYHMIPDEDKKRYSWIEFSSDYLATFKYKISTIKEKKAAELSEGLSVPNKASDAIFIYNIIDEF